MFADAASDVFTGKVVMVVVSVSALVAGIVCSIITVWLLARRQPPVQEELYQNYVTKAELAALRSEVSEDRAANDKHVARLHTRMDELRGEMHEGFETTNRALGRIEGYMEQRPRAGL